MTGGDGSALAALLALELCFWVGEKERLASLSMLSRRAAKRASLSLVDTETKLERRSSRAATLALERWRRRRVGIVNRPRDNIFGYHGWLWLAVVGCCVVAYLSTCTYVDKLNKVSNVTREDIKNYRTKVALNCTYIGNIDNRPCFTLPEAKSR